KKLEQQATNSELLMKSKLERLNFDFIFQKGFIAGKGFYIVDFYIPSLKTCVEVDGPYHLRNRDYDARKDWYLTDQRQFAVVRISNAEVLVTNDSDIEALIRRGRRGLT